MHLGSIYLIVNDFEKSVSFYEKILKMPVSAKNMSRFAQFQFEGNNISIMNGHFDAEHPDPDGNILEVTGDYQPQTGEFGR